jgi:hypothetical protein
VTAKKKLGVLIKSENYAFYKTTINTFNLGTDVEFAARAWTMLMMLQPAAAKGAECCCCLVAAACRRQRLLSTPLK